MLPCTWPTYRAKYWERANFNQVSFILSVECRPIWECLRREIIRTYLSLFLFLLVTLIGGVVCCYSLKIEQPSITLQLIDTYWHCSESLIHFSKKKLLIVIVLVLFVHTDTQGFLNRGIWLFRNWMRETLLAHILLSFS